MSKLFLTNIDLNKNQIENLRLQNLPTSAAPASPVDGQVYYDTTLNSIMVWDADVTPSGTWQRVLESGSVVDADIKSDAAIALSKLETDPLARANHTGSQAASTISDLATVVKAYKLNEFGAPTAAVAMNAQKITGLADPTLAQDAATKAYVDAVKTGLDVKESVKVATTANIATLSGTMTIDAVGVVAGDRVLVKDQTTGSQNGIWVVATGAWSRATDADTEINPGMFVFVEQGTANADSGWVMTADGAITVGTTALTFAQFSGAGQITAGTGLTKTGNTINAAGTVNRISVTADAIDISTSYVGQNTITTLGTIGTGVWNATTISVGKGGTGATTLTGYVKGNGTGAMTAAATVPGSEVSGNIAGNAANVTGTVAIANGGTGATTAAGARTNLGITAGLKYVATSPAITVVSNTATWTVTHSLSTQDVIVQLRDGSTNAVVEADVVLTNSSTVTISWISTANVAAGAYKVVVLG
jgi:hypothetical protein